VCSAVNRQLVTETTKVSLDDVTVDHDATHGKPTSQGRQTVCTKREKIVQIDILYIMIAWHGFLEEILVTNNILKRSRVKVLVNGKSYFVTSKKYSCI